MTRLRPYLFACIAFSLLAAAPARAQQDPPPPSRLYQDAHNAGPLYAEMARAALARRPAQFDFTRFRSLYSRTRQYDPIGQQAVADVNEAAFRVLNEKDPKKAQAALASYQSRVATHLAHLGVVMQALSLARQDKRFGKVDFFEWVREGLIDSVMNSRKGRSLDDAFAVVTLPEETTVMARLGLRLLKAQPNREHRMYYTMNDVKDPRTGEEWTLFVNTTIPMEFLEAQRAEKQNALGFGVKRQ